VETAAVRSPRRGDSHGDGITAAIAALARPLKVRDKARFAAGDIVDGTINFGIAVFIFYYLTVVCGLAGAILAISTICDAVLDPLIGSISDRQHHPPGIRLLGVHARA
jgi:Na+/melibiose symporter-like transporter